MSIRCPYCLSKSVGRSSLNESAVTNLGALLGMATTAINLAESVKDFNLSNITLSIMNILAGGASGAVVASKIGKELTHANLLSTHYCKHCGSKFSVNNFSIKNI